MVFLTFGVGTLVAFLLFGLLGVALFWTAGAIWVALSAVVGAMPAAPDFAPARKRIAARPDLDKGNALDPPRAADGKYPLRGALDLDYRDVKGQRTERYIEASSLEARGGVLYLWGWCEMRHAIRQFRVDQIQGLSDGETGEVIDARDIAGWLTAKAGAAHGRNAGGR
jgi:hypothetical protein